MPNTSDNSPRIECAQVYGGTGRTETTVGLPGLDACVFSEPCEGDAGGDIYFFSICGSGVMARFCVADVAGHGEDVAAVSREAHDMLKRSMNWTDHRRVLRELNRALTSKGITSLTTAAMFTYFPPKQSLSFSYAGHPRAWHWSVRNKSWSKLELERVEGDILTGEHTDNAAAIYNLPLAVDAGTEYSQGSVRTDGGDLLVVITDGVTEAMNAGRQYFGETGLRTTLESISEPTPERVMRGVVEHLRAFSLDPSLAHDDVTVLAARIKPMTGRSALGRALFNRLVRPFRRT